MAAPGLLLLLLLLVVVVVVLAASMSGEGVQLESTTPLCSGRDRE